MTDNHPASHGAAGSAASPSHPSRATYGHAPQRHRSDGWTSARLRQFIDALSESGNVAQACRALGLSRQSAYVLRRNLPAFRLAWDGAVLRHRDSLVDICMDRAINGVTEEIVVDGRLIERTRADGATLRFMMARADRMAESRELHDRPARLSEGHLEDLLDMLDPPGATPMDEAMADPEAQELIVDIYRSALPEWDEEQIARGEAERRRTEAAGAGTHERARP